MRQTVQFLTLLLACAAFGPPRAALAQSKPALEFAAGAGNPTGTGPVNTAQVITFQNNTDNPNGNAFTAYAPTLTATFSLTNQQYTAQAFTPGTGLAFGSSTTNPASPNTTGADLFPLMNAISFGGVATATANGYFTSANGVSGGIDVTTNNAVQLLTSAFPLPQTVPANQRYRYADLTITFNRPVTNPVVQLVGLGGFFTTTGGAANGFATEFDLLTSGVTLSKLDGSTELVVSTTGGASNLGQVRNGTANPTATTGAGAASGSILVTTPTAGISTLTFRVFLRPLAAGGQIHDANQAGDVWLIGVSQLTQLRPPTANNITNASVVNTSNTAPVNSLSGTSDATISYVLGTLPSTSQGTLFVNGVAATSGQTLTATQATQLSFNANSSFVGTYSFTYTLQDDAGGVSNTATYSVPVTAAPPAACANPGRDGSTFTTTPNTYYPGSGTATAGTKTITVGTLRSGGSTTAIAAGDLLLVMQMQGSDINTTNDANYGSNTGTGNGNLATNFTAGQYEYVVVASVSGTTVTTATNLTNTYTTSAVSGTATLRTFQIVRVPQYSNLILGSNLAPPAWNGATGGIIALDVAGTLDFNGKTIDVSGLGFRGGAGRILTTSNTDDASYLTTSASNLNAQKGEGTAGTPQYLNDGGTAAVFNNAVGYPGGGAARGGPGNAGGGGNDNLFNTGGAGGGNGGGGGRGGNSYKRNIAIGGEPGATFAASSSRLVLGGGGGAGSTNEGTGTPASGFASSGALGGGIVVIRAGAVASTGTILANAGATNSTVLNDGAPGAGAGGSILVTANNTAGLSGLTLAANGGNGGSNRPATNGGTVHGPGGGGGGGVILTNGTVASATATGGAAGTSTFSTIDGNAASATNTSTYGSAPGTNGQVNTSISTAIANSTAGANCIADVATTISGPANATAGSTVTLSVIFSNIGALTATGTTRVVTLPAGVLNPVATGATITGDVLNGYTITYPATSLAPGASDTYAITYTAPGAGPVVANSAITTNTNQGGLTANDNSSVPTAIGLVADVTTALTGPQTLTPGQPSGTYTASFTNEGPSTASTVMRTVTLPAGATNVFRNGVAYTAVNNVIDFGTATTLASGASNAFTFSFTPATTATGSLAVISNVSTTTSQGNNTAPDASTITAPVAPLANVSATVTANTANVAAGTLASAAAGTRPQFTAVFNNSGPATAAGVVASVQLPAGLTNVTATNGGVYNNITGLVTYDNLTSVAPNTPTTSVINFDAPASGPVVATAIISTTTGENGQTANNQASAPIAITPAFDLTTSLSGPATAVAGDLVTLNVTTTNNGPSPAANAVQTVQLPTGLANVYVSNGGVYNPLTTTQSIIANGVTYSVPAGGVVFPTVASLPTGQTVANSVSFAMPTAAFTPTALVTPNTGSTATTTGDTNTNNNTAALVNSTGGANVTPATALAGTANAYTTISTSAATTTLGTPVTLTVVTGNNGPSAASGVTQTVQLQPGFTTATLRVNGVTGSAPVNNVITFGTNGPTYNTLTGLVTFPNITSQASATSVSNTLTLTPTAATVGSNGQLLAMATVRTTNTDPVAADNVASVGVTLNQSTDLATTITGPSTTQSGQTVTYTASFTNNGPMAASNVTETAQLPAGLGVNGVTITDGAGNAVSGASYASATGLVTFPTLITNASGAQQVFKLTFTSPGENFVALSSVGSPTPDAAAANNSASAPTTVTAVADLATTVTGPATAVVGNPVTYTVTTTNNGLATAANATTTLSIAPGFSPSTLLVNGTTGTLNGNTITYSLAGGTTATYNTTTGSVTFSVIASLPNGTSASNSVSFLMPNAAGGQTTGVASVAAAGIDPVAGNNTASVATSVAPTTTTTADLVATVTASAASVTPNTTVTFTATYSNNGPDAGVNVVPTLQLVTGLTTTTLPLVAGVAGTVSGNNITYGTNGPSYNTATGVLTFPTIASQASGATGNVRYDVQVVAPNNGPLPATAVTTSNTSEPNVAAAQVNNANSISVAITPSFDVVTSISGPTVATAGTSQTYTVTTTNNGPSATGNVTTQTVTVPAGQTPTNISNGGVYSSAGNTITWTVAAGQGAGSSSAVANSFTIVQPTTSTTLMATVSASGEGKTDNNTASITIAPRNLAPLAYAVVNSLQNPQSNEAGGLATGLLISSLNASDPENSFAAQKYTIVAIPTNTTGGTTNQGVLYASNDGTTTGTYTAVVAGQTLTDAQAQTLRFKAATGYVGNASFTYSTTDAAGNTSPVVNYTIPVQTDVNTDAVAYTKTVLKGGTSGAYAAGDVIAYTTDVNGAVYNSATSLVYQANGTLQPTVAGSASPNNGIIAANEVAGTITGTGTTTATTLADIGLAVDATGRLVVAAAPSRSNLRAGNFSVQILTIDANGGTTSQTVSFTIGANPLPVVLTALTAQAVQNRDALLTWTTASEVNSAYFEVERSLDGKNFTKIGQQAAKGNSAISSNYTFTDANVAARANGAVYYRLRQVDLDATASYSPVRTVSFTKVAAVALSLYPNPAQNATTLDVSALPATGTYQVLVLDVTGRAVRTVSVSGGQLQTLNLTDLASGTYQVLVTGTLANGDALRQVIRLTKE